MSPRPISASPASGRRTRSSRRSTRCGLGSPPSNRGSAATIVRRSIGRSATPCPDSARRRSESDRLGRRRGRFGAAMTSPAATTDQPTGPHGSLATMALGALGVVYGDIGTSPLYTFKTALQWAGGEATAETALGMLSLIVWTLIITTSVKYVAIVMRADNDGEGGILALMSLLGIKHGERTGVIAIGIMGAALLYGDGAITPAISVLSALEGLKAPMPELAPYVPPVSVLVLVAVFALQPQGTARIGALFGRS